ARIGAQRGPRALPHGSRPMLNARKVDTPALTNAGLRAPRRCSKADLALVAPAHYTTVSAMSPLLSRFVEHNSPHRLRDNLDGDRFELSPLPIAAGKLKK